MVITNKFEYPFLYILHKRVVFFLPNRQNGVRYTERRKEKDE